MDLDDEWCFVSYSPAVSNHSSISLAASSVMTSRRERDLPPPPGHERGSEERGRSTTRHIRGRQDQDNVMPREPAEPRDRSRSIFRRFLPKSSKKKPLLFYDRLKPYYEFTNFALGYPIRFEGRMYPTSEHLFQSLKFLKTHPEVAERIRNTASPREAFEEAGRHRKRQRNDWFHVNIRMMELVLEAKFTQHPYLRDLLLKTGDRELVEDSPYDDFWGCGKNGQGKNELGRALMRLRYKLRRETESMSPVIPNTAPAIISGAARQRSASRASDNRVVIPPLPQDLQSQRRQGSVQPPPHRRRRRDGEGQSTLQWLKNQLTHSDSEEDSPLYFYEKDQPYYEFTNFSHHPVWFAGKQYPTSEHLFQAQKFLETVPDLAEFIRLQPTSRAALEEAVQLRPHQRPDWYKVNRDCMDLALEAKFTQHSDLRQLLLSTGNRTLIEASPVDGYWGYGKDKRGRNELGKALMRLRDKFRTQDLQNAQQGVQLVVPTPRGRSSSRNRAY